MRQNTMKSSFLLVLAAFIWGVAFVAQSVGMDYVGPFTFIGARYLIGGLVLIPCIAFLKKLGYGDDGNKSETQKKEEFRIGVKGGIFCGLALFISSSLQQIGIMYTTVGKAGFITALYIVIVPILGIFMKKKVSWTIWISVAVADRHVSALHYRWLFYRNRRYLCIFMRHWIFFPYFSDRSFLTKSGWRADLLCAVLCGWNSGNNCGFCSGDTGS